MRNCGGDGYHGLLTFGCIDARPGQEGIQDGTMWNWLISNNGGGGACSRLYMDTYRADCEWGDWGGSCQDYADVPPDEMTSATWQHVAITYDGTTLVGYRNGDRT